MKKPKEASSQQQAWYAPPSDAERLAWCLRYGYVKTLGGALCADDREYHALTLDLIDRAISRDKAKAHTGDSTTTDSITNRESTP